MSDDLSKFMVKPAASAARPLAGLTVLVVEDSRFACEAMRLLCLRSGARIRRADCLRSARRHLATYRPSVVIIDLGLPDGSGEELIRDIASAAQRVPVILGTSGNPDGEDIARRAGADGFLAKPIESLAEFQTAVLSALPDDAQPQGLRPVPDDVVAPDPLALRDDLNHVAEILSEGADEEGLAYLEQFLPGVALSARDTTLTAAVADLAKARDVGGRAERIGEIVQQRLAVGSRF